MNNLIKLSKLSKESFIVALEKNKIDVLLSIKSYLDDKYYNTGDTSEFTDEQYDILKEIIIKNDKKQKSKVGEKIREDDNRVKLPYWLGSIDKIKREEINKLENWLKKNKSDEYIVESKLDGISCLLMCKNGIINLYTRGDGEIGADITHLTKYLKNIPVLKEDIAIRGELIMKKNVFKEKYKNKFANARNMVSGLVNSKSLKEGYEDINLISYEIIYKGKVQEKQSIQIEKLKKMGFEVVKNIKINLIELENLEEILFNFLSIEEYEIDGIIVQSNKEYIRNEKDNPKYAFAFKMTIDSNLVEAEVEEVQWNVSKHKLLKPRIKIKPVNLNGVTITYTSGFNAKYIIEKSIGKGSIIKLTRSGDVIPFIVDVIKSSKEPQMPDVSYKWNENNVDIIIEDDKDNISDIKMISSFFSHMSIKNVSDATVEKIYNEGYNSILKILEAKKEDFEKIDGFQKKLAEKVYTNIHNGLQNVTKDLLLGSACIFGEGIGRRKLKVLFDNFPEILESKLNEKDMEERIMKIEGFSEKTVEKIVNNIENAKEFLSKIDRYVTYEKKKSIICDKLKDITVLFSGFRNAELEKEIINKGGKMITTVSKNLKVLIVKDKDGSSSKIEKAKKLDIDILYEDEFIKKYL